MADGINILIPIIAVVIALRNAKLFWKQKKNL